MTRRIDDPAPLVGGLSAPRWSTLLAAADLLIPRSGCHPAASELDRVTTWLEVAMTVLFDDLPHLVALLDELDGRRDADLGRALSCAAVKQPEAFDVLSTVVAAGYLMAPEVKERIGYPGPTRYRTRPDEAVDQIMSGLLDPVVQHHRTYRRVDGGSGQ